MPESLPTKLDGVVLVEPQVHGDERGFMVESFRRDAWAAIGIDWQIDDPLLSERDKNAPRLADLADSLPF